jgi:thioredoxin
MEITSNELRMKIESGEPIIVDFWATFCGPCKMYKPTFEKIAENSEIPMYTMSLDSPENGQLAIELGIRAVPTTKGFNNGGEVFSKSGMISESELKSVIKNIING